MIELEGLRFKWARTLINLVAGLENPSMQYVERRYRDVAEEYERVSHLLIELLILREVDGRFQLAAPYKFLAQEGDTLELHEMFLRSIMAGHLAYRTELWKFLERFQIVDGHATCSIGPSEGDHYSGIRNLLIDMGVVQIEKGMYSISPDWLHVTTFMTTLTGAMSPKCLGVVLKRKSVIGQEAERRILEYERERIGPPHSASVDHVAERNVAAGYDIYSVSLLENSKVVPRLIEVKAVSIDDFGFYFSRNEREVAQRYGPWYYLYLLPTNSDKSFNIGELLIIHDPIKALRATESAWTEESDMCHFWLPGGLLERDLRDD